MKKIKLSTGQYTLVDNENFKELSKFAWGTVGKKYTYAGRGTRKNGVYSKILMHRFLMNASKDQMVDHINGNTLDNRKSNLRICSRSKNLQNSKIRSDSNNKYKGVHKVRTKKDGTVVYSARIQIAPNERLYLGNFYNELEAAKAYNKAALKYFGEYANINKLEKT